MFPSRQFLVAPPSKHTSEEPHGATDQRGVRDWGDGPERALGPRDCARSQSRGCKERASALEARLDELEGRGEAAGTLGGGHEGTPAPRPS
jgi:hypothetical protein